jgi:membrane protein
MDWIPHRVHLFLHYIHYLVKRVNHDRLTVNAGYMAYITLLSLVPLTTVLLTALSRIPTFAGAGDQIQDFIFRNFVPAAGEAVQSMFTVFIANTTKMTTIGLAFLFVAALLLISSIDSNLNYIWRSKKKRARVYSFSLYWTVLTLGPIFVGASIVVSSYITGLRIISDDAINFFYQALPILFSFSAFFGLYMFVPNLKVRVTHALTGALIAGILFEVSKKGFAIYITQFPTYELIYGALSAVPILFVWVYLCWFIVLVGAEITASLGEKEFWHDETPYQAKWFVKTTDKLKKTSSNRGDSSDSPDTKSE